MLPGEDGVLDARRLFDGLTALQRQHDEVLESAHHRRAARSDDARRLEVVRCRTDDVSRRHMLDESVTKSSSQPRLKQRSHF